MSKPNFKRFDYHLHIEGDADAMREGYDGDVPLDPEKEWTADMWCITRVSKATGKEDVVDSMCAVWYSEDEEGHEGLAQQQADFLQNNGLMLDNLTMIYNEGIGRKL